MLVANLETSWCSGTRVDMLGLVTFLYRLFLQPPRLLPPPPLETSQVRTPAKLRFWTQPLWMVSSGVSIMRQTPGVAGPAGNQQKTQWKQRQATGSPSFGCLFGGVLRCFEASMHLYTACCHRLLERLGNGFGYLKRFLGGEMA